MRSILDKSFKYVSAARTDLRATFSRIRKEMEAKKPISKVTNIQQRKEKA